MKGPFWWVFVFALGWASTVEAQPNHQLWGDMTVDWLKTERLSYEVEVEPQWQFDAPAGDPTWKSLQVTPNVEYAVSKWADLVGEALVAYTDQSNDDNNGEATPRIGVRLHILSQIIQDHDPSHRAEDREKRPGKRLVFSTLLRLENRHQFYSNDPDKSSWRFRDRFDVEYPLNRPKVTENGAVYFTSDAELYIPLGVDEKGGVISQVRVRTGFGYRRSFAWRYEALYIWTGERNSTTGVFAPDSGALDIRLTRVF